MMFDRDKIIETLKERTRRDVLLGAIEPIDDPVVLRVQVSADGGKTYGWHTLTKSETKFEVEA